jgi:hypothetical protein
MLSRKNYFLFLCLPKLAQIYLMKVLTLSGQGTCGQEMYQNNVFALFEKLSTNQHPHTSRTGDANLLWSSCIAIIRFDFLSPLNNIKTIYTPNNARSVAPETATLSTRVVLWIHANATHTVVHTDFPIRELWNAVRVTFCASLLGEVGLNVVILVVFVCVRTGQVGDAAAML